MNPSTLAHIIQQLIAAQEENDALIEECARLNQMLHPMPEQPEIEQQQPEPESESEETWWVATEANEEAKQ